LNFSVKGSPAQLVSSVSNKQAFTYDADNHYDEEQIKICIPKGSLYSNVNFEYSRGPQLPGSYSAQHRIHRGSTPVHRPYEIAIKADASLSKELESKALIVNSSGQSQGGVFEKGFVSTELKTFGTFYIKVDTIPPRIIPVNINDGKIMTGISQMIFKIADNLSGIATFKGKIDGQWVLMEYDQKSATLWHRFDERTLPGKHQLELVVVDKKGNEKTFNANFTL
ncbi:MAG: M23 family peptidase, partial [Sphingobacteriaceae bacterium]